MTDSIIKYIEFLKKEYGLSITLHGSGLVSHLESLAPYNTHECAYCMYVKSSEECWHRCRESQKRAEKRLIESGEFFGSCYAGVGEFVFPVRAFDENVGMISVGSYIGSSEKRAAFAARYGFRESKLSDMARDELKVDIPPLDFVKTLISPLSAMLTLLIEKSSAADERRDVYGKILSIIHTGYMRKLTVAQISQRCHYSISYINRLFKEKSKMTVNGYLSRLRMQKARELLLASDMKIEDVAASVGFFDVNYFISFFSKFYGMPPKRYRNANKDLQK